MWLPQTSFNEVLIDASFHLARTESCDLTAVLPDVEYRSVPQGRHPLIVPMAAKRTCPGDPQEGHTRAL
jgi:hypothetical protein